MQENKKTNKITKKRK